MENKWKQFNLLEVASISEKRVSDFEGERDYVATRDIDFNRIVSAERVTYKNRASRADLLMTQYDVLFAKMKGTIKVLVGSKAVEDKIFSTGFYILSPEKNISKDFLYFFFLTDSFNKQKDSLCTGATMSGLNNSGLKRIKIPIPVDKNGNPDLAEQKRIVTILEEAEVLKKKRAEADQKMDTLVPEIFIKMFTDSLKDTVKLGDYIDFLTSGSRGWAKYYSKESGSKFIRIQNVKNAKLNFSDVQFVSPPDTAEAKRTKVKSGDLLISITADLGRTAVVDQETAAQGAYINQHLALVRLDGQFNPLFVAYFLETKFGKNQFLKYGQAAAKKGLNFDSIKSLKVPKPPIILQNRLAEIVKEIEVQKEKQKQSAGKLDKVFQSLLSKHLSR